MPRRSLPESRTASCLWIVLVKATHVTVPRFVRRSMTRTRSLLRLGDGRPRRLNVAVRELFVASAEAAVDSLDSTFNRCQESSPFHSKSLNFRSLPSGVSASMLGKAHWYLFNQTGMNCRLHYLDCLIFVCSLAAFPRADIPSRRPLFSATNALACIFFLSPSRPKSGDKRWLLVLSYSASKAVVYMTFSLSLSPSCDLQFYFVFRFFYFL